MFFGWVISPSRRNERGTRLKIPGNVDVHVLSFLTLQSTRKDHDGPIVRDLIHFEHKKVPSSVSLKEHEKGHLDVRRWGVQFSRLTTVTVYKVCFGLHDGEQTQ